MIIEKEECKSHFEEYGRMTNIIDDYMICTAGSGLINDYGNRIEPDNGLNGEKIFLNGCNGRKQLVNAGDPVEVCKLVGCLPFCRKDIDKMSLPKRILASSIYQCTI